MKNIYVEKWECVRSSYGKLYKIDLEEIAEEEMMPELLEMSEEEAIDWLIENEDIIDETPSIVSVCCESDPDHIEQNIYANSKDALDSIEWRGFNRGYPDNNMSREDAVNKDAIIADLKEELEELKNEK